MSTPSVIDGAPLSVTPSRRWTNSTSEHVALWCSFTQTESLVTRLLPSTWRINYFGFQSVVALAVTFDAVVLTFMRAQWKLTHGRRFCGLKTPSRAITAHSPSWGTCQIADEKIRPSMRATSDLISPDLTCSTRFSFSPPIPRISNENRRRLLAR